jgi:hypothetical protein
MGPIQQDQLLHTVFAVHLLQLGGNFEADACPIGVANDSVGTFRLDLLDFLDVRAGHTLNAVIRHIPCELEAIGGELALGCHPVQWGGNSLNWMHLQIGKLITVIN